MILLLAFLFALDGVDAFIERAMKELRVPGVAVGVISNGEVILAKGYGVRSTAGAQPVTADTAFALGSVTKSFTSLALATLVDEGKLDWDKPVRDYLPWFRLHDPIATELITTRDMLSHRSGLPRYDSMRFLIQLPREELIRRLRFLPSSRTFRDVFQYNNLMYVTAGFLGGHLAGSSWEDLVRTRVFAPLGMKSSTVSVVDMQKGSDFAKPHEGAEVPFYDYQQFGVGPNGAVNSSVNDMLRYARFYLEDGTVNGKRVVSVQQMRELWKPVTVAPGATYALGWFTSQRGSYRQVAHGGAITGFTANLLFIPEKKIVVIVLNNSASPLTEMTASTIADRLLGQPDVDYLEQFLERRRSQRSAEPPKPVPAAKPAREMTAFVGAYTHPAYGPMKIVDRNGALELVTPVMTIPMRHNHDDVFALSGWLRGTIAFEADADGKIAKVTIPVEAAVPPLAFTRVQ